MHCVKVADIEAAGICIISSLYIYCFFGWNCLQQQAEFRTPKCFSKGSEKNIWNCHWKCNISKWMWGFNCQYPNEVVASHLSDLFFFYSNFNWFWFWFSIYRLIDLLPQGFEECGDNLQLCDAPLFHFFLSHSYHSLFMCFSESPTSGSAQLLNRLAMYLLFFFRKSNKKRWIVNKLSVNSRMFQHWWWFLFICLFFPQRIYDHDLVLWNSAYKGAGSTCAIVSQRAT